MTYALSDIHGESRMFTKMLQKIRLGETDTLYFLGDAVDRGDDPVGVLENMMERENIIPIMGNHDLVAASVLEKLEEYDLTEKFATGAANHFPEPGLGAVIRFWRDDGGKATLEAFSKIGKSDRARLIGFMKSFRKFAEVTVNGMDFVMVHGGLPGFTPEKPLADYQLLQVVSERTDYSRRYFPDKFLVTGHTPTVGVSRAHEGKIYINEGNIALDCGACFGLSLGCLRFDDMAEFYVRGK